MIFYADAGDDKVYGGAGDDIIIQSGSGSQHYDGESGIDTLRLDVSSGWTTLNSSYPNSIEMDMVKGEIGQTNNTNKRDTFTGIENITFIGNFTTFLTGNATANTIEVVMVLTTSMQVQVMT